MGARKIVYGLTVKLKDKASRGLKNVTDRLEKVRRASRSVTRGGGLSGMLSGGLGGGIASATAAGGPQSGIGGMVSDVMKSATKLLTMPAKILSSFTRIIPGIGGVFSGILGTATNALESILNTAANVVGGIINVFSRLTKAAARIFGQVLSTATRVFGKVGKVAGAAFMVATGAAVKFAGDMENAWNKVKTIVDLGDAEDRIKRQLRDLATTTGRSVVEIMEGYYQVLSAGVQDPIEALKLTETALKGAVGGGADFGTVVKTLTRSMKNFKDSIDEPREAMDVLLKTVDVGQIEMPELANVFPGVANAAGMAGAAFRETAGALGVMAQTGPVEKMATQLRGVFLSLTKPSDEAKKTMQDLKSRGIDVTADALKKIGLVRWLKRIQKLDQDTLAKLFPDRRALMGINTLQKQLPELKNALSDLDEAAGKTESNFKQVMDSMTKQAKRAWQGVKDLAIEYAQPILDVLKEWLKAVPAGLKEWRPAARKAGEAVAGALETALEKLKDLYEWIEKIDWSRAWSGLKELPGELASTLLPKIKALFGKMTEDGFEPGPILDALIGAFQWAAAKIEGIMSVLWERIGRDLLQQLLGVLSNIGQAINERIMREQEEKAKEWYNESKAWAPERAVYGDWDERSPEKQEEIIEAWGRMNPLEARAQEAGLKLGTMMQDIANEARPSERSEEEREKAEKQARDKADKKSTAAAERFTGALEDASEALEEIGDTARDETEDTLPEREEDEKKEKESDKESEDDEKKEKESDKESEESDKKSEDDEKKAVDKLAEHPLWKNLENRQKRAEQMAQMLESQGYSDKAREREKEAQRLDKLMSVIMDTAKDEVTGDEALDSMLSLSVKNPEAAEDLWVEDETDERDRKQTRKRDKDDDRADADGEVEKMLREQQEKARAQLNGEERLKQQVAEAAKATRDTTEQLQAYLNTMQENMQDIRKQQNKQSRMLKRLSRA